MRAGKGKSCSSENLRLHLMEAFYSVTEEG